MAGSKMKSLTGWNNKGNGFNNSGFSGLPGGMRHFLGVFNGIGLSGYWWSSSSEKGEDVIYAGQIYLHAFSVSAMISYDYKGKGLSVRCIKDFDPKNTVTSFKTPEEQFGILKDSRDGKVYKTVKIGEQIWMAENFDGTRFLNGDAIQQVRTLEEWRKAIQEKKPAWCYNFTGENSSNKLYNVWAVFDPRGLAPKGWHLPNSEEISALNKYFEVKYDKTEVTNSHTLGLDSAKHSIPTKIDSIKSVINSTASQDSSYASDSSSIFGTYVPEFTLDIEEPRRLVPVIEQYGEVSAGRKLRTIGWGDGTNESGFNAKPYKCINGNTGKFIWSGKGNGTYWWMQKYGGDNLRYIEMSERSVYMDINSGSGGTFIIKYLALSVRFIKD